MLSWPRGFLPLIFFPDFAIFADVDEDWLAGAILQSFDLLYFV